MGGPGFQWGHVVLEPHGENGRGIKGTTRKQMMMSPSKRQSACWDVFASLGMCFLEWKVTQCQLGQPTPWTWNRVCPASTGVGVGVGVLGRSAEGEGGGDGTRPRGWCAGQARVPFRLMGSLTSWGMWFLSAVKPTWINLASVDCVPPNFAKCYSKVRLTSESLSQASLKK